MNMEINKTIPIKTAGRNLQEIPIRAFMVSGFVVPQRGKFTELHIKVQYLQSY